MPILYLHGLNGSSQSHKANMLRAALAPVELIAPDYPAHRPDDAVASLTGVFRSITAGGVGPVVVGSSMGGFYGQYLARHFPVEHLFLINPALTPWTLLAQFEGTTMTTARGETYTLTRAQLVRTRAYGVERPCNGDEDGTPTTLFLDRGDEVIDYRIAEALYRDCGHILAFDGGDHAFQHLETAVGVIRSTLLGLTPGLKR